MAYFGCGRKALFHKAFLSMTGDLSYFKKLWYFKYIDLYMPNLKKYLLV